MNLAWMLAAVLSAQSQDYVWWEAEQPKAGNFPDKHPYGPWDERTKGLLSGGAWIGADKPGKTLFLEYEVAVPKDGDYAFYVRKFWHHGPIKWRFDEGPWKEVRNVPLLDGVELATFIGANWMPAGKAALKAGTRKLRVETLDPNSAGAIDCFLLTLAPFTARGRMKPGEKYGTAAEGWFPFEPDADAFAASPMDLRGLNEKWAGELGWIQAKGDAFVHEKTGKAVRFWATNTGWELLERDAADLARYARFHAKLGVNLVRLHGHVWRDDDPSKLDEGKVAKLHGFVDALKKEGIYLELSTYFPIWFRPKGVAGLEGYDGSKNTFVTPYYNEKFQEMQRGWWRGLLTAKHPKTGVALGQDPALAMVEIVNEDSVFFWTFKPYEAVPAPQMEILERKFGDWLKTKHGNVEAAFAKWGGGKIRGDDAAAGRAGFMPLWDMANRKGARAADTAEFLAELQRRYYDGAAAFLKKDLGYKGLVTGSNWVTADARVLGPLDKWSNAGLDFIDRHGYYGGPHKGDRAGYSISKGDQYDDASGIRFDGDKKGEPSFNLPLMDLAYNGKPSTISEINWTPPGRFRAEMPFLCAAWGSLQGTDAFFFFANGEPGWGQGLGKFNLANPSGYGQFPAAAVLYRKGLVKTGEVVARAEVKLSDLRALKGIPVSQPQNLDEFRKKDVPAGKTLETADLGSIDPLAFLCGRVEVNVSEAGGTSKAMELSKLIDRSKKVATSASGELRWDWGRGVAVVDAPSAQGAAGFLGQAPVALAELSIETPLDYAVVLLVPLDDQPIKTSRRMLLQVMSEDQPYGWSAPGEGLRTIEATCGPPLTVRKLAGKVSLKRPDAASLKVTALDFNGYPDRSAKPGPASSLELLPSTLYYLLEK